MLIVVLGGAGDVGGHVVRDLLEHSNALVTIADRHVQRASKMAAELGERVTGIFVDANNRDSLLGAMRGANAVVGCIGPFYAHASRMARAAIRAGVPYVDICDDFGPVNDLFALREDAQAAGTTVITGLGWTPGLSNVLARRGADQLDDVDEIRISWVGGPGDSRGQAVIAHVLTSMTGDVPTYRDGVWSTVPARSGSERVQFPPPFGDIKVFHFGHPEPLTIPRTIAVKTVSVKGALTPRWNNWAASLFARLGLTRTEGRIGRLARLVHAMEGVFAIGGIPRSGLRVDVIGHSGGEQCTYTFTVTDRMGRLTGVPAAIGALMLARGEIAAQGVFAPESCIEPESFLKELSKRGIEVNEVYTPVAAVLEREQPPVIIVPERTAERTEPTLPVTAPEEFEVSTLPEVAPPTELERLGFEGESPQSLEERDVGPRSEPGSPRTET